MLHKITQLLILITSKQERNCRIAMILTRISGFFPLNQTQISFEVNDSGKSNNAHCPLLYLLFIQIFVLLALGDLALFCIQCSKLRNKLCSRNHITDYLEIALRHSQVFEVAGEVEGYLVLVSFL